MSKSEEKSGLPADMSKEDIKRCFQDIRAHYLAKNQDSATTLDNFHALALTVRHRIVDRWMRTQKSYHERNARRVYYLSMEFLIGRLMGNYMFNLGKEKDIEAALREMDISLDDVRNEELDAGLGNGGLGRLAACFLDSMATLRVPAYGYGIRYDYGIFNQKIQDGNQFELPDEWMRNGNPWEIPRPEYTVKINFYGRIDHSSQFTSPWVDTEAVLAVPYDIPIPGYKNDVVNTLRLWSARATDEFEFDYFNHGNYDRAVQKKILSESISKVLYPNDNVNQGKELRLKQEYFFTAAAIADIIRRHKVGKNDIRSLHNKACIQLNDTHPTLAILELMRVLLDQEGLSWEDAWSITSQTFAYTNHTLLPEALECWTVPLMQTVLPRHLEIAYEVNARFLADVARKFPGDNARSIRMSVIQEGDIKRVRMGFLAIIGSFSVNGVSALHSTLLKTDLFKDFYEMFPERFNNKTNGITPRRWLLKANPRLADLITETVGDRWVTELEDLRGLERHKDSREFRRRWQAIKQANKVALSEYVFRAMDVPVDPNSLFDVQVKRIHEYKRQFLFGLYIISQYLSIKNNPAAFVQPRTFIIGGKAAPGYYLAKLIIKFLNNVAMVINQDKPVREKIRLVFLENYRVSLAEKIMPAADLSEQISTAGMEASGTGNMKFALNGALTIGTLDGANIEMLEHVGADNIFIFGNTAPEVAAIRAAGYQPRAILQRKTELQRVLEAIRDGRFCPEEPSRYTAIYDVLVNWGDQYLLLADYSSYIAAQDRVDALYRTPDAWARKALRNIAGMGPFSSDRTIAEYARDIWRVQPMLLAGCSGQP